ncbi:HD domain-containing protein [Streptomyces sp. NRRL F-5123]|uniref:HD domain-containing protein n=1 Tax=Streptomyces sp. NRRL F-5123 TaxID=1463856 RepID=UPI0004E1A898|nr:HD domain-containing protein [Streptomyces sp. NRRL F-5123]
MTDLTPLPTPEDIRRLHERYAPSPQAFESVHGHCVIVWRIAEQLLDALAARGTPAAVDRDLVRAGCLVHDIGVYRLYDADGGGFDRANYIRHGLLGHEILAAEGLPEVLCRFCSHHTGVGLTKNDVTRQNLPLPPADYLAETPEEQLVMYADKFHSKSTPPRFLTPAAYTTAVRRFGDAKAEAFTHLRHTFGDPDVHTLSTTHAHRLVDAP